MLRSLVARRLFSSSSRRLQVPLVTVQAPFFVTKVAVPEGMNTIPAFRVLDGNGKVLPGVPGEWKAKLDEIPTEKLVKMYETMLTLPVLDAILFSSQRQGRISFYMTSYGEEGAVVGSAAAWKLDDEVFSQYRESGVLLWRGVEAGTSALEKMMAQVFASKHDQASKGRQMPVHYGDAHFHTVSSPLGTQVPQAAGAAYALKRTPGREDSCVVCYLGEGAASEGDFATGLNMAAVLGGPVIFFVRNNGFAISTPSSEQYAGDGIASRGPGYGVESIRVDGNDPLAVYLACVEARRRAVEGQRPILIEAMSYRISHHSTSDDSSAYRSLATVDNIKKTDSPILRLRQYLESLAVSSDAEPLWSDEKESTFKAAAKKTIMASFVKAERDKQPGLECLFTDVYQEMERPQREQKEELKRLVRKWGQTKVWKAALDKFDGGKDGFLNS